LLLAPPNQGSEIMDHLCSQAWAHWFLGPVVRELGIGSASTPNQLGPQPPETAVIMGGSTLITLFLHLLDDVSDGIVSADRGHVEGEAAFHIVDSDHTLIMWRPAVLRLVVSFLQKGSL